MFKGLFKDYFLMENESKTKKQMQNIFNVKMY